MISATTAVTNLLGQYAECMDSGDFAGAAELFRHAQVKLMGDTHVDADQLLVLWTDTVVRYADGTPRTKHVITNPIVEIDGLEARCRSYYTVFQQLEGFALQPIIAGRYDDRFECVEDTWRWTFRDYSLVDLVGDLSRHLRMEIPT
jgi:3-phenylpropionate/cinnamic acid dioxygenase small subunit